MRINGQKNPRRHYLAVYKLFRLNNETESEGRNEKARQLELFEKAMSELRASLKTKC